MWYKIILIILLYVEMSKKGQGLKIIARPTIGLILSFYFCTTVVILWSVIKYMM